MRIAVDAFGGDNAPKEIIKGAVESLADPKLTVILVGKEDIINEELKQYSYDTSRLEIVHATEVITNDDSPTIAFKRKKDSSIVVGLKLLKESQADAFVSAGSTGALLTAATMIVGRISGIERPALATLLPNKNAYTFLVDCGANVDSKPTYLLQFAKMGSIYMKNVMNVKNPRVALINVGTEKEKGNALTKEVYTLLEAESRINFIGNMEARDIPLAEADVAVCDAFVGNVILKHSEGLSKALFDIIKAELMSSTLTKIGAALAKPAFKNIKKRFDYSEVGGAPFLGLNALVVKAHGSSNAKAIHSAIKQCAIFIEKDITQKIKENI